MKISLSIPILILCTFISGFAHAYPLVCVSDDEQVQVIFGTDSESGQLMFTENFKNAEGGWTLYLSERPTSYIGSREAWAITVSQQTPRVYSSQLLVTADDDSGSFSGHFIVAGIDSTILYRVHCRLTED